MFEELSLSQRIQKADELLQNLLKNGYPTFQIELQELPPRLILQNSVFQNKALQTPYVLENKYNDLILESNLKKEEEGKLHYYNVYRRTLQRKKCPSFDLLNKTSSDYDLALQKVLENRSDEKNMGMDYDKKSYVKARNAFGLAFKGVLNDYLRLTALSHYGHENTMTQTKNNCLVTSKTLSLVVGKVPSNLPFYDLFLQELMDLDYNAKLREIGFGKLQIDVIGALQNILDNGFDAQYEFEKKLVRENALFDYVDKTFLSLYKEGRWEETLDANGVKIKTVTVNVPFIGIGYVEFSDFSKSLFEREAQTFMDKYNAYTPTPVDSFAVQTENYKEVLQASYQEVCDYLPQGEEDIEYIDLYKKLVKKKKLSENDILEAVLKQKLKNGYKENKLFVLMQETLQKTAEYLSGLDENKLTD